jgi:hypothetical protein
MHQNAQIPGTGVPKRWQVLCAAALGIGELHVTLLGAFKTRFKLKVFK